MRLGVIALVAAFTGLLLVPGPALADPCLVVYPAGPTVYHYESAEYYTVGPGHPLYDPLWDRGGLVLLETGSNEIPLDIYQAPNLGGFLLDEVNQGYFTYESEFDLVVDGFRNEPFDYENILLVFDRFDPPGCLPVMVVDGVPATYDPGCGWHGELGNLSVVTPTPYGHNFSDVMVCALQASGCLGVRVWAFADDNHNHLHDGGECFSAYSHDVVVPFVPATWGKVKAGRRAAPGR